MSPRPFVITSNLSFSLEKKEKKIVAELFSRNSNGINNFRIREGISTFPNPVNFFSCSSLKESKLAQISAQPATTSFLHALMDSHMHDLSSEKLLYHGPGRASLSVSISLPLSKSPRTHT